MIKRLTIRVITQTEEYVRESKCPGTEAKRAFWDLAPTLKQLNSEQWMRSNGFKRSSL